MGFVEVRITTATGELVAAALERLTALMEAKGYIGWQPQPADIITILIESLGPLAGDVMGIAATVPPAAFRNYGTELLEVSYNEGASAAGLTRWTLSPDSEGKYPSRTIPLGTQVTIGNLGFYVANAVEVKEGESSVSVRVVAVERGTAYNKLTGRPELVEAIDWVKEVALEGETTGGAERETDEEYLSRLKSALTQLALLRPITATDYAICARVAPSNVLPSGVEVGRATAIDGYNPETTTFTGTLTAASATVTEVSSFTGISAGTTPTELAGTGIPAGTTVKEVKVAEKELVMSANATAAAAKETIQAIGSGENERTVTVFVTDKEGKELSAESMTALEKWLREKREINFRVYVRAPSYKTIYVTAKIHVLPGYEEAGVVSSVKEAVVAFLSPETWGNPTRQETGATSWLNQTAGYNVVRYNQLIGAIEGVRGVAYVFSGAEGLTIGFAASPTGTSDLTLTGPAPLPQTATADIVVTTG